MRTQGNRANSSGNVLEQTVISTLKAKGFEVAKYREWEKDKDKYSKELLLKNVPFKTIYGHKGNTEFLLKSEKYNLEIRIECKWQQSKGSVDEKFPYLYLNCIEVMPEKEIIIIVDGGGYKEGALEWLKNSAKEHKYQKDTTKKIEVMNLSDFIIWVNKTFI
ncbi:MAG TPA: 4-diphosphocytidyl-2C-methyl-D-erythritol kinase [Campylobacterales bacterium]|nr:4-diphosphocytidyl-2C-methyl-D-erythritol kinase [Campylobacterales bacterium]